MNIYLTVNGEINQFSSWDDVWNQFYIDEEQKARLLAKGNGIASRNGMWVCLKIHRTPVIFKRALLTKYDALSLGLVRWSGIA